MTLKAVVLTVLTMPLTPTVWAQPSGAKDHGRFTVTLLGTGTPGVNMERFGPSTLVEVGDQRLLFDCGRAVTLRLAQMRIPLNTVQEVFFTHLHSDHITGLPDLWLTSFLPGAGSGGEPRTVPLKVYGPPGSKDMMMYLKLAYTADITMRLAEYPRGGVDVDATDISEGVVYDRAGVRVTGFEVDHGEANKPAFGYRVDYQGRSVVISGDTKPSANLARYATGTDVLIHEVFARRAESLAASPLMRITAAHHTSPEEAGRIFTEAKPKLAVFTHISTDGASREEVVPRTRTTYSGPLEVGEDLMMIDVWDATVRREASPREP